MIRRSVTTYGGQTIVRYKLGFGIGAARRRGTHGWQLALHIVHAPGSGAWHNHYWDSWSLCLLGGLAEATDDGTRQVRPGTLRFRPHSQRHRVRGYAVTLILTSPRRHRSSIWLRGLAARPIQARSRAGYSRRALARLPERRSALKTPPIIAACVFLLAACSGGGGGSSLTMSDTDRLQFVPADRSTFALRQEAASGLSSGHMPIADDGRYRYVGVDQGTAVSGLPAIGRRRGVDIRAGSLHDGAGPQAVAEYLDAAGSAYRFFVRPSVRVIGRATETERQRVEAAIRLVNVALPQQAKIQLQSPLPQFSLQDTVTGYGIRFVSGAELPGTIHVEFLGCADYYDCAESGGTAWSPSSNANSSYIQMNRAATANNDDRLGTVLLTHELLHALGLSGEHAPPELATILEGTGDIYAASQNGLPMPASVLYPVDREALRAFYSGLDPAGLGQWASSSLHVAGNAAHANFGVALRNGYAEPWAHGFSPQTSLADNASLSGRVTWTGVLLGVGPDQTVSGDAAIAVSLATLRGSADFTNLEAWNDPPLPGDLGDGVQWLDGDLGYAIAVRGNTFRETGGDAGRLTGIFTGRDHEGAAGTLEREDLVASFGAQR